VTGQSDFTRADLADPLGPGGVLVDLASEVVGILAAARVDAALERTKLQVATVAKSGGDFTLPSAALAAITTATTTERWLVIIYPGDYTESNPVVCKKYVSINCPGRHEVTRVLCTNPGSHGLQLAGDMDVVGLQVRDASGTGSAAFHVPAGEQDIDLHDCKSTNCNLGSLNESGIAGGESFRVREFSITSGSVGSVIKTAASSETVVSDLYVGPGVTHTTLLEADGVGADIQVKGLHDASSGGTNGLWARNGGVIHAAAVHIGAHAYGIRVSGASEIHGSVEANESTTFDVWVEDAAGAAKLTGFIRREFINCATGSTSLITALDDDVPGDEAFLVLTNLQVGKYDAPMESTHGGGNSYTFDEEVYQYDASAASGSRFTSVTTAARSATASQFGFPAGAAVGDALLWAVPRKFPGLKHNLATLMVKAVGPATAIVWEHWNGTSYVAFNVMEAEADDPHDVFANDVLVNDLSTQLRFDDSFLGSWVAADNVLDEVPNYGSTHYVVRARITGQAPTTPPTFQQSKIYPAGRLEINSGGLLERMGTAEKTQTIPWHPELEDDLAGAGVSNTNLELAANIELVAADNVFAANTLDGRGGRVTIPVGLDTSRPLTFTIGWRPSDATAGDVELELRHAILNAGDVLDGTIASTLQAKVTSVSGQQDELIFTSFNFSVPTALPGAILALSYFRDGGTGNLDDDYGAAVEIVSTRLTGKFWR